MAYSIDSLRCVRSNLCMGVCPMDAIQEGDSGYYIVEEECISCQMCKEHCPVDAISED